ncbi:MAG: hypothetical protein J6I45_06855 [Clostridia bacterium]|nr:hypothetical protein [Clostridia bacterium]
MNTANQSIYQSPAYKRSRAAYCMECAAEYFVSLLVTETFLAKLLTAIGLSDDVIGIISSLISLSFLFQLAAVFVVKRIKNTKRFSILFHTAGNLLFMSLYLIPFLPFAAPYRQPLVIACILAAYFGNYFVTTIIYRWGNSFVEHSRRGRFSAGKEMISLISGMVVTVSLGYAMDAFEAADNLHGGFIFSAAAILIFSICDLICLLLIQKEDSPAPPTAPTASLGAVLRNTFRNRQFLYIVLLCVLINCAQYTTIGFLGTYQMSELALTVGTVQLLNIIGNLGRFAHSRPFGVYTDRHSFTAGIKLALVFLVLSFLVCTFVTPSCRWLIVLHILFHRISYAGTVQNLINITYNYVDSAYFVEASAIKNSISGIAGFGASILAGRLLAHIQQNGNTLFGIPVYGQQVLSLISAILSLAAILFVKFVIEKHKIIVQ